MLSVPVAGAVVILVAVVRGEISLKGLIADENATFSLGRLQLLVATLLMCVYYLGSVVTTPNIASLPDFPSWFNVVMLASSGIYLGGKSVGLPSVVKTLSSFLRP